MTIEVEVNLITVKEAAARTGVSARLIHRLVLKGDLPARRIGEGWQWFIRPEDLVRVKKGKAGRPRKGQ